MSAEFLGSVAVVIFLLLCALTLVSGLVLRSRFAPGRLGRAARNWLCYMGNMTL